MNILACHLVSSFLAQLTLLLMAWWTHLRKNEHNILLCQYAYSSFCHNKLCQMFIHLAVMQKLGENCMYCSCGCITTHELICDVSLYYFVLLLKLQRSDFYHQYVYLCHCSPYEKQITVWQIWSYCNVHKLFMFYLKGLCCAGGWSLVHVSRLDFKANVSYCCSLALESVSHPLDCPTKVLHKEIYSPAALKQLNNNLSLNVHLMFPHTCPIKKCLIHIKWYLHLCATVFSKKKKISSLFSFSFRRLLRLFT